MQRRLVSKNDATSMQINAEKNTPLLASKNDTRITKWGKIMRKYRLDELPQFYNVLIIILKKF